MKVMTLIVSCLFLFACSSPNTALEQELSETKAGRALNRALFTGFYDVFTGISYDLGEMASRFMVTEEL